MNFARKPLDDPDRVLERELYVDIEVVDLLARAADAHCSGEEAITGILNAARRSTSFIGMGGCDAAYPNQY